MQVRFCNRTWRPVITEKEMNESTGISQQEVDELVGAVEFSDIQMSGANNSMTKTIICTFCQGNPCA